MLYEVAWAGALIALLTAVGTALWVARRRAAGRRGVQTYGSAPVGIADKIDDISTPAGADDDPSCRRPGLDVEGRSALTACVFAAEPADHLCWTAMVVDPALHDTPSHIRLVGLYETEFAATDAAAHLADALNECLIPGEAPLTATALGIEPAATLSAAAPGTTPQRAEPAWSESASPEPHNPEPHNSEPLSHIGRPIAYGGTPLAGHAVLTDLDGAPFSRR